MTGAADSLRLMTEDDLSVVADIEARAYSHPWTHGNFADSLRSGHVAHIGTEEDRAIVAYSVVMLGVDEDHLLNVTVDRAHQRRGWGRRMLLQVIEAARARRSQALWLEVRSGNVAALALYDQFGFVRTGLRRSYYPAATGREDAVLMSLPLLPSLKDAG